MADFRIAGVMRAGAYSPNHIGNDAAIFNAVADQLRKRGCEVNIYSEQQFQEMSVSEDTILNMCREQASITKLQALEDEGRLVINSGYGIENCTRERMTRLLLNAGVPSPDSLMVNTNENIIPTMQEAGMTAVWVKRGDFHAMHKEDVSFCRHPQEAQDLLHEYFYRGINRAVINRHLEGDLIKFYGVRGENFFYWFYPYDLGHSKYGYEAVNGKSHGYKFSEQYLRDICQQAAEATDVVVYGGDCIVDSEGGIRIIDFNDWPSFAPCRDDAAPHIAKAVLKEMRRRNK